MVLIILSRVKLHHLKGDESRVPNPTLERDEGREEKRADLAINHTQSPEEDSLDGPPKLADLPAQPDSAMTIAIHTRSPPTQIRLAVPVIPYRINSRESHTFHS
jgi:hypothetical protein